MVQLLRGKLGLYRKPTIFIRESRRDSYKALYDNYSAMNKVWLLDA